MTPVQPVPTDGSFDLRAAIRRQLEDGENADPAAIANEVMQLVPNDAVRDLALMGVHYAVRQEITRSRRPSLETVAVKSVRVGKSRWKRHQIFIDGLGDRLAVAGVWKMVADCTADDLEAYAEEQEARASSLAATARIARDQAEALRSSGCATVADLYRERGEKAA